MIQRIKMTLIALSALVMPVFMPAVVAAQTQTPTTGNAACAGVNLDASALSGSTVSCDTTTDEDTRINNLVIRIINIFTWLVGVVSVLMIIFAGFRYVVSSGDSGGVSSAKNTIIYAIVGLIVVIMAQVIVRFVLTNVNA